MINIQLFLESTIKSIKKSCTIMNETQGDLIKIKYNSIWFDYTQIFNLQRRNRSWIVKK